MLPDKATVGWRVYSISKFEDNDDAGQCDTDRATIKLKSGDEPYMAHTLLHELFHAAYYQAGLRRKDSEERVVTNLSNVVAQVIRDNPDVIQFIIQGLRK